MDSVSRRMFRIAAVTFVLGCLPSAVQAQTNLAASYRFERYTGDWERRAYPLGLQIGAEQVLGRGTWSVVGGVDFARRSWDTTLKLSGPIAATVPETTSHNTQLTYAFDGGLRFAHALTRRTLRWHAQMLGGAAYRRYSYWTEPSRSSRLTRSDTEPFLEVAGGVTHRLTSDVFLLGEAGYRRSFDRDPTGLFSNLISNLLFDANVFHFTAGIQFPLVPRGR